MSEVNLCGVSKYSESGVYVFLHPTYNAYIIRLNDVWKYKGMHIYIMCIMYFSEVFYICAIETLIFYT